MIGKLVTLLIWLACGYNLIVPFADPLGQGLFWLAIFLLLAHTVECVVYASRVKKAAGSNAAHFLQLLVFGYFHAISLPE